MEQKYLNVRKQLEELGYYHSLHPDDVPLVEKLVGDLIQTTESLQKYMKISQDIVTERDNLLLGAEPFKCDNAKLVKECNELHLTFLQYREQNEKLQTDLKRRIATLEKQKIDSDLHIEKLKAQVKELELEAVQKSTRQQQIETARLGGKSIKSSSTTALLKNKSTSKDLNAAMSLAEDKISNLSREISKLKDEKLEMAEANISYKNQINSRDKEIQRLTHLLKGGRPMEALNKDCCYKDIELKVAKMQEEISRLKHTNSELEERLKDAICKQHEAMKRALGLAERNRVLEKEMKDIDQMALAVEKECNTSVKDSTEKVNRLQNRLHEAILQIQQLEKEAADLRRDKQEMMSDLEVVKNEKRHLQSILESALDEKKRLTTRLNQYGIIENDLNLEIDRLVQASADQKRRIAELECRLLSGKVDESLLVEKTHKETENDHLSKATSGASPKKTKRPVSKTKTKTSKSPNKFSRARSGYDSPIPVPENSPVSHYSGAFRKCFEDAATSPIHTSCTHPEQCYRSVRDVISHEVRNKNVCIEHLREIIGQEIDQLQSKANLSLDQFKRERDYYMKECHSLMDKLKCMCRDNKNENSMVNMTNLTELQNKLSEKEQQLTALQYENRCLSQEKHNLMTRLETARDHTDRELDSLSFRSVTRRLERERDLLKGDIQRLEEERDGLRHRINLACENHTQEKCRLEAMLREQEELVHKLEQDRREYMHTQGSRRATINNLQDECDLLNSHLKTCQSDLNQQRAMYTQLKSLHEQTDRALSDCQSQLTQSEKEMAMLQEKVRDMEVHREEARKEIINLKNDLTVMKNSMAKLDQEKDMLLHDLDEKTERIAALDDELKTKQNKITSLETSLNDIRKRMNENLTERSGKEQLIRQANTENQRLQQELDDAIRTKDMAYQENRRLQDDLASCTNDNRRMQNELDIAKRQVDDVKRQLQHYVSEVKRAEDLISQKEVERTEILDHYRSLTEEASNLESSNHTLETEATQAKIQLSVTLDHAADLERKVDTQETMIRDYEKQIADLTSQIARLESKVDQCSSGKDRVEAELASVRELCVKLDKQKDSLMRQLNDHDNGRQEILRDSDKLKHMYQNSLTDVQKERNTVESLERHLAQCRQECVDLRLSNEELQEEVKRLKAHIEELRHKLASTAEQLDMYQEKALDYSNQNKQLRREVVNERFHSSNTEFPSKSHLPLKVVNSLANVSKLRDVLSGSHSSGVKFPGQMRQQRHPTSAIQFPEFSRRVEDLDAEVQPIEEEVPKDPSVRFSQSVVVNEETENAGFQQTLVPLSEDSDEDSEQSLVWVPQEEREGVEVEANDGVDPAKPSRSVSSTSIADERDDEELSKRLALRTRTMSVVNLGGSGFKIDEGDETADNVEKSPSQEVGATLSTPSAQSLDTLRQYSDINRTVVEKLDDDKDPSANRSKPDDIPVGREPSPLQLIHSNSDQFSGLTRNEPSVHFDRAVKVTTNNNNKIEEALIVPINENSSESLVWLPDQERQGIEDEDDDEIDDMDPEELPSAGALEEADPDDEELVRRLKVRTRTVSIINFGRSGYQMPAIEPSVSTIDSADPNAGVGPTLSTPSVESMQTMPRNDKLIDSDENLPNKTQEGGDKARDSRENLLPAAQEKEATRPSLKKPETPPQKKETKRGHERNNPSLESLQSFQCDHPKESEPKQDCGKKCHTVDAESMTCEDRSHKPCECWKYCTCCSRNLKDNVHESSGANTNNVKSNVTCDSPTPMAHKYCATYTFVYEPKPPS